MATLVCSAQCGIDNIPNYDPIKTVIDCTDDKDATDICDIMLVVEPLETMTYYDISSFNPRGYRVAFNLSGHLVRLRDPRSDDISKFIPPIQTDGHYRTIIAVNGQMPAPSIITHYNQTLNITVFNELVNTEGISIHWHGIHQRGTPEADGVAYITQYPILPLHSYAYTFKASPAGTHWYHAHSGEQRADGLYGALIVRDDLPGNVYDYDNPEKHTLLLMDWQRQPAVDLFRVRDTFGRFYKETPIDDPPYVEYSQLSSTLGPDNVVFSPIPFWSGIINDKGRFYDENGRPNIVNPNCDSLNCFDVSQGGRYRFRLIGAQAFITYRFSIEGHSLTVVASDGSPINSIEDVDYVIVSPGERYDVIVYANNTELRNFWIWAETLEDEVNSDHEVFYNPISKHRAEAILHYNEYNATDITEINETKTCTTSSKCKAVNCPFPQYGTIMECINVEQFESPSNISIPQSIHSPNVTLFYSIGLDGISNFNGFNFRSPSYPPLTEYAGFQNSNDVCQNVGCDREVESQCICTQVIDISHLPRGSVVELVIANRRTRQTSRLGRKHAMHLHGHYFYVVAVGYADYDENGIYKAASDDIECIVTASNETCTIFATLEEEYGGELKQELKWKDMTTADEGFNTENKSLVGKDTLTVPYGGYVVIRFVVDNPGWWLFHCHVQIDQSAGMSAVIQELSNELSSPDDNKNSTSPDGNNNNTSLDDNNNNTCMPTGSASSSSSFNVNTFSLLAVGMIIVLY